MTHFIKNRGIGLIEVLITTLVVAVGLLAVAALQGNLMKSTGENKASAEAKTLCETKIEQLRDAIAQGTTTTPGTYNAILAGTTTDSVTGTNETFTRAWTVTELTTPAKHKQISVTCRWGNNDADHQVIVQSLLSFDDIAVSLAIADAAATSGSTGMGSPSTNAGSSDDAPQVKFPTAQSPNSTIAPTTTGGMSIKVNSTNGKTGSYFLPCSGLTLFENGLYTRRVHYQGTGTFKEAIELFKQVGSECYWKTRYNGGVIIPIKGRLYSNIASSLSLSGFNSSEKGVFCTIDSSFNLTTTTSLAYSCYVGGKCSSATAGTTYTLGSSTNTIVTQCPATTGEPYPTYDWVGAGGWRGRIGIKGLMDGNSGNTVCFPDSSSSNLDTAREYFSLRNNGGVLTHEGINKPYLCHDFIVAASCPTTVGALNVANSLIKRTTTGISTILTADFTGSTANNIYDSAVDKSSCHVISGTVPSGVTAVGATSSNGGFDCTVTGSTYECIGTSKETSVTVSATAGGTASSDVITLSNSTMLVPNKNLSTTVITYQVNGTVTFSSPGATPVTVTLPAGCSDPTGSSSITTSGTAYSCTGLTGTVPILTAIVNSAGTSGTKNKLCIGAAATGTVKTTTIYSGAITANKVKYIIVTAGNATCP